MVGHLLQYHNAFIKIKEYIRDGGLGKIRYIYSNRLNLENLEMKKIYYGVLPLMILSIVGSEPTKIRAVGKDYITNGKPDITINHLEFKDNIRAHIMVSWLHPYKDQRLVVIGDKRMAVFNDQNLPEEKLAIYNHSIDWRDGVPPANKSEYLFLKYKSNEPLTNECLHFIKSIKNNTLRLIDGNEGLRVLKVLNEAKKNLKNNDFI